MKKAWNGLFYLVFLMLCTTVVFLKISLNEIASQNEYLEIQQDDRIQRDLSLYYNSQIALFNDELFDIDSSTNVYSFSNQSEQPIYNLVETGAKLVLRTSQQDCISCIDSTLTLLKRHTAHLTNDKIIIFTDHQIAREAVVYLRTMDVKYPAFRLKKNTIDISSEESTPFFFVLDKSMKIKMLYVVSKD